LGKLRDVEYELLVDNSKYAISETCLALTIFRHELSPSVLGMFGVLLFIKAFHWLARSRLEYFEQVEMVSLVKHVRLCSLMWLLVVVDILLTYYCVNYTLAHGKSVLILFGFEFGVLIITSLNTLFR
jgi:E3 ubiquitin-protein ligase synoviolin